MRSFPRFRTIVLLCLLAMAGLAMAGAGAASAYASTVVIWPVDPVLKPGEQATGLWLENKGDTPVTLQIRSFLWSQGGGEDHLTNQEEVVASPPIATVAAGKRQLVRIIRRTASPVVPNRAEQSYRLIIDELPTAAQVRADGSASAGLAVQMRYSIPLFVHAADVSKQQPTLVPTIRSHGEQRFVEIRNTGAVHARLTDLRMLVGGQQQMVKLGLAGYILPGATMRFSLPDQSMGIVMVAVNGKDMTLAPAI